MDKLYFYVIVLKLEIKDEPLTKILKGRVLWAVRLCSYEKPNIFVGKLRFETSSLFRTIRNHMPEDLTLHCHCRGYFKSNTKD
jgi:hypothetical protein